MMRNALHWIRPALVMAAFLMTTFLVHAEDVVRLGNLKRAHFGAISYIGV